MVNAPVARWTMPRRGRFAGGLLLLMTALLAASARSATPIPSPKPHWAFRPVEAAIPPHSKVSASAGNPVDAFISFKLAELGIEPTQSALKSELLRRATYDLTGLPPSQPELEEFLADTSPHAWETAVDRLLASPGYGERWAQHWLDLAHYADSNGFELDADRPDAWRYRDWVIKAFNDDMPYDRFLTLQISGDESAPGDRDALIASGFARSGPREVVGGNIDPEVRRQDELTEATTTLASTVLGLTMGCARCHDHKFDPLPTTDYYRLEAFFSGTHLKEIPIHPKAEKERYDRELNQIRTRTKPLQEAKDNLEAPYRERLKKQKENALTPEERAIRAKPKAERTLEEERQFEGISVALRVTWEEIAAEIAHSPEDHERREKLKRQIYEIEREAPRPPAEAMAMSEESCERPETWVLGRGNVKNRKNTVEPRPPEVLLTAMGANTFQAPARPIDKTHSGWRLSLAQWLVATNNPLTARVIVNRVWQHHFGRGLVSTSSDFGTRGDLPTNPALLDFLAAELLRDGWHLKPIHRLILLSNAYQRSSDPGLSNGRERDPDNHLLWRMNRKRMDAEALRDSILAVSGQFNRKTGGPGVLIDLEPEVRSLIFTEQEEVELWPTTKNPAERCRRSVYVYRKRNVHYPLFDAFDAPDALTPCPIRAVSTHAPQALVLFNSGFAQESANAFAQDLLQSHSDTLARIREAFVRCYARTPTPEEVSDALRFVGADSIPSAERWSDFALALLNSNEFIYVP